MRAVTFLTKKQVRLCYPQLRFAAVLYAAVPVAVFLLGWLKLYWGIPAAALLAAGLLGLRPGRKEPSAAAAEKAVCVPVWALAVVLVFALAWCFLGGQGGYFYQNSDFANRNGVLHDLVNYPWPVYYQSDSGGFGNHGNPFALVYYICHWLLPALAGKLVLAVTGAAGAAWPILRCLCGRALACFWCSACLRLRFAHKAGWRCWRCAWGLWPSAGWTLWAQCGCTRTSAFTLSAGRV